MCVVETAEITSAILQNILNVKKTENQIEAYNNQAKALSDNAAMERQAGLEEARKIRLKTILQMGNTQAKSAAGNIVSNSGTALDVLDTTKMNGDIEALSVVKNSEIRAKKYISQSDLYLKKARMTKENMLFNLVSDAVYETKNLF